jgi:glycosyltransferase 2 family protein
LKKQFVQVLKWAWLVLVFGGVIYYLFKNYSSILKYLRLLSPQYLVLSAIFLIIGKLALVELSRLSLHGQGWNPSFKQMFYINSQMQLAKYLPGGIWHFVGRFGLYCSNGVTAAQASKSILIENFWLVTSALLFGITTTAFNQPEIKFGLIDLPDTYGSRIGVAVLILFLWALALYLGGRLVFRKNILSVEQIVRLMGVQLAAWLFFGIGFLLTIPDFMHIPYISGAAVGGFSLGWVSGYITLFAPSGLGVREAVLTAVMAGYLTAQGAVVYSAVSRVIWVITEIILGVFCEIAYGAGKTGYSSSKLPTIDP